MWGPAAIIDVASIFEQVKTGRIEFHQQIGDVIRVLGSYDVRK
jgi:hypothetical protein